MVYPKQPPPPGAVDSLKDKVLALHDYEGTCGLCLEPCDSTQDELNALSCTFEPCPSPSIYHQSCLEAYLKSIRLDKQRKTGFACPRNCGKAAKGEKACPGRVSKSHPIYARNDNSKKRRKAKMPDQLVVPPPAPAAAGKKPPLPKASPKGTEDKSPGEEAGKVVALVRGERGGSKAVPILVVNSAKQQAAAAHEEARAEVLLIRARSAASKEGSRTDDKGPHQKKGEAEADEEYAPPRGPASLADFAVSITKVKGRKGTPAIGSAPEAKKSKEEVPAIAPPEGPPAVVEAAPAPTANGALQASPDAASEAPPSPKVEESPRKALIDGPRQEEAAKTLRSPSKSQRKHQQRLAARHLREKQDAGLRTKDGASGALQAGLSSASSATVVPSSALQQPLETVQETAAFPPLPSSKPVAPPPPVSALPALRLTPPPAKDDPMPEAPVAPEPEVLLRQADGQAKRAQWSTACEAALRERKIQVHAAQLQGLGYFSEVQCVAAVRACGADLGRCCDWLLSGGTKGPATPPQLDISAELSRLADLAAAGPMTQATLEAAVLRCQGDIDAALRPASVAAGPLPAPPMSIVTTPALSVVAPPVAAVSPGAASEFGAISRPSSSSSNRSAGSPWGGLDSRGSSSEASSFFSTSAWGSLGPSLVPSPPSQPDAGTAFSPFGGGFPSELLRSTSLRADPAPLRSTPAWPIPEGGPDGGGGDSFCSRDGSFLSRGGDPFGSFGVRSASSVEAWSLSDLSDPDSADSALSEAHQSTVTSVAAAVLQDSFDDPVPPAPPAPGYGAPFPPPALWAGHYQDGPHMPQRMTQLGTIGHPQTGFKHGNPGGRTGPHFKAYGPNEPPPALWGFNGIAPPQPHPGFGDHGFFEGPGRAPGMPAGYGRQAGPSGPLGEGGQYAANGRQPRGMQWRDVGPGRGFRPEGPHHWADQDRLVTQLLSQLLV